MAPAATLGATIGILEIAVLLSSALWGVITVQVYFYAEHGKDRAWLRAFVGIIWLIETLHTVVMWIYIYDITVNHMGNMAFLMETTWTLCASVTFQSLAGSLVQAFFAYRVYLVSRRPWIPMVSWAGSSLRACLGIAITVLARQSGTLTQYKSKYNWATILTLSTSVFVDVTNTASLCYHLANRKTGFQQSNRVIDSLMRWAIETGLVTSMCAITMLITLLVLPHDTVWLAILLVYAKLYSNSLMVSLNSREHLRQPNSKDTHSSLGMVSGGHNALNVVAPYAPNRPDRSVNIQMSAFRLPETGLKPTHDDFGGAEEVSSIELNKPSTFD
ncbi:hypothetical protein A0H81_14544 [Grifola frondosa]|uniref:DUF6534 domain-containing protein n=1 Tax=Grifola frondosa TaxID=5627 RepID=A0A1C7LN89_GRIFR|nr:hypothetical protein A0H81_14544 [Grifola frondosa]